MPKPIRETRSRSLHYDAAGISRDRNLIAQIQRRIERDHSLAFVLDVNGEGEVEILGRNHVAIAPNRREIIAYQSDSTAVRFKVSDILRFTPLHGSGLTQS